MASNLLELLSRGFYTVQRVIFVGENFREKLEEAPRIKFHGFKFRGARQDGDDVCEL